MEVFQIGPEECDPETDRKDFDWVVIYYKQGDYEGDGTAVAYCRSENMLYVKNLSHRSCYGPMDGSLESGDKITPEAYLKNKPDRESAIVNAEYIAVYDKVAELLGSS